MAFNKPGDLCIWYKGNGIVGILDVQTLEELRVIDGIAGTELNEANLLEQTVIRKLVAWDDFSKIATLNLHDKATRDEIYLTICDVNANNFSFS